MQGTVTPQFSQINWFKYAGNMVPVSFALIGFDTKLTLLSTEDSKYKTVHESDVKHQKQCWKIISYKIKFSMIPLMFCSYK